MFCGLFLISLFAFLLLFLVPCWINRVWKLLSIVKGFIYKFLKDHLMFHFWDQSLTSLYIFNVWIFFRKRLLIFIEGIIWEEPDPVTGLFQATSEALELSLHQVQPVRVVHGSSREEASFLFGMWSLACHGFLHLTEVNGKSLYF